MIQKIIKVGNSYAVTIPRAILNKPEYSGKEEVEVEAFPEEGKVVLKFRSKSEDVDPEVYKVAKDLLKRYAVAFEELAGEENVHNPEFLAWLEKFNQKHKVVLTELAKK